MAKVELYSKPECCLCDVAKDVLVAARRDQVFDLAVIDISESPELMQKYGEEIPVVFIDGRKAFKYRVDPAEFLRKLGRA